MSGYTLGQGVSKDEDMSVNWIRKAASQRDVDAQKLLQRIEW